MPGTNLTRDEARTRADLLGVESYSVDLDLDPSRTTTFGSTTVIRFTSRVAGASTFADLVGATVHEITLNGQLNYDYVKKDSCPSPRCRGRCHAGGQSGAAAKNVAEPPHSRKRIRASSLWLGELVDPCRHRGDKQMAGCRLVDAHQNMPQATTTSSAAASTS